MLPMTTKTENDPIIQTVRGAAFCTTWHAMDIAWNPHFDQAQFTVEMWALAKLPKEWLVTCTFPEANERGELGWGLHVGSQGELAGMIVGKETRWVWNQSPILDGQWHHLAMTYDG